MAKNFTFQTAIKLNSASFKKGVKDVQKSLNSLRSSFLSLAGALGVGLSFSKILSEAKKTKRFPPDRKANTIGRRHLFHFIPIFIQKKQLLSPK